MFTVIQWALDWDEHMNTTHWIFHVLRQSFPWMNILTHLNGVRECSVSDTTLSSVLERGLSLVGLWNVAWWVGSKKLQDSYSAFAFSVSPFLSVSHSLSFLFPGSQMKNLLLAIRE